MKKTITALCAAAIGLFATGTASAQQTHTQVTDSLRQMLNLARQGIPEMQNEVGKWYYLGRHVTKEPNFAEAVKWWARAAEKKNPNAIGNLARCYQLGHGVTADSAMASDLFIRAFREGNSELFGKFEEKAKGGDLFSIMLVAKSYDDKVPPTTGREGAVPFYEAAARKGKIEAYRWLGTWYLNRNPHDYVSAAAAYRKGAEAGDLTSTFGYGQLLLAGKGVKADPASGANYILKAAENGHAGAMAAIGDCYMKGVGVTHNPEQAVKWYMRASGTGIAGTTPSTGKVKVPSAPANQWKLAECFLTGNGAPMSYDRAIARFNDAVFYGNLTHRFETLLADSLKGSQFENYGRALNLYYDKKYDEAMPLFQSVAKAMGKTPMTDATVMTAAIYLTKGYKKYDVKKGVKILTEQAKTNPLAMYMLAKLYERGDGVDKNMTECVNYMTRAAQADYGKAMCALADIYFEGRGVDRNYNEAVKWYLTAENYGLLTTNAAKRLAVCYENGYGGLEVDKSRAAAILAVKRAPEVKAITKLF